MKKLLLSLRAIIALAIFISSCTKTVNTTTTITSPTPTGTLIGFVTTLDQYGFKVNGDLSGVTVSLSNGATATTDVNGRYEFDSLKSGDYTGTYAKAGYGTVVSTDFNFIGGGTSIRNVTLSRIPSFQLYGVTDSIATPNNNGIGMYIKGIDTVDTNNRGFAVFASSNSGVSSAPANFAFADVSGTIKSGFANFSTFIPSRVFNDAGIASGTTAFIAVYPISATTTSYADPATGKNVYTSVSATPSAVLTVTVP